MILAPQTNIGRGGAGMRGRTMAGQPETRIAKTYTHQERLINLCATHPTISGQYLKLFSTSVVETTPLVQLATPE